MKKILLFSILLFVTYNVALAQCNKCTIELENDGTAPGNFFNTSSFSTDPIIAGDGSTTSPVTLTGQSFDVIAPSSSTCEAATDGTDDFTFSFEIEPYFDVYGGGGPNIGGTGTSTASSGRTIIHDGTGLKGQNATNSGNNETSTGDVSCYNITVDFATPQEAQDVDVQMTSINTRGESFESTSVIFLNDSDMPYGTATYNGFWDGDPEGSNGGTNTTMVNTEADMYTTTGTGVFIAADPITIDISDSENPVAATSGPNNDATINAATDAGLNATDLVGGFVFRVCLEDVATTTTDDVGTTTNTQFTSTLNNFTTCIANIPTPTCDFTTGGVYITELSYNPSSAQGNDGDCEYIEIFNAFNESIDLGGWSLDDPVFTFPSPTIVPAGGYVIVADGTDFSVCNYVNSPPVGTQIFYWTSGGLGNSGESVTLSPASGCTASTDMITYDDGTNGADGDGDSIYKTESGSIQSGTPTPGQGSCDVTADNLSSGCLPVELLSFNASQVNDNIDLSWTTATEENNDYFQVEHSLDGKSFVELAKVQGAGTTVEAQTYSYVDTAPKAGVNYYRLKQVDFDGTFEYSAVIVVNTIKEELDIKLHPVPTSDVLVIETAQGIESIEIMDITGRTVMFSSFDAANRVELNVENLLAGTYFLAVKAENKLKRLRFLKN